MRNWTNDPGELRSDNSDRPVEFESGAFEYAIRFAFHLYFESKVNWSECGTEASQTDAENVLAVGTTAVSARGSERGEIDAEWNEIRTFA